jgi:hypothetical protein
MKHPSQWSEPWRTVVLCALLVGIYIAFCVLLRIAGTR